MVLLCPSPSSRRRLSNGPALMPPVSPSEETKEIDALFFFLPLSFLLSSEVLKFNHSERFRWLSRDAALSPWLRRCDLL